MTSKPLAFTRQIIHRYPWLAVLLLLGLLLLVGLACNAPASEDALKDTQIALNVEATQLARQEGQAEETADPGQAGGVDPSATQAIQDATQIALSVQMTLTYQPTATPTATEQPSETPAPTNTPLPTETPAPPSPTVEMPTETQPQPTAADIDALIQDSKILLFENVTKIPLPRYIKQALDTMGLARNYTDTKDAIGTFKAELLSGTDWDLIIVGVEARSAIEGEFFDYFNEQLNKGAGLVLEIWNLDEVAGAKAGAFLTRCGVKVQGDWFDPSLSARSIWWLYGEHPIFHEPNEGMSLVNYSPYWFGDAGDLLETISGGDAVMLAGTYAEHKNSYGVLATCLDGRVVIQTYSSHDYNQEDVMLLWQNYIYNALRAHFEYELSQ